MEIEYKEIEGKTRLRVKFDYEKGEIQLCGTRIALTNLLPACEKIDKMFGTGGEVIMSCMAFEQGNQLFEAMMEHNPDKSRKELLNEIIDAQPQMGWGITTVEVVSSNPPKIEVSVKNSLVKTSRGSSKHLIGSFWAGVLSKYLDQQLKCANFSYVEKEDEFHCTITA